MPQMSVDSIHASGAPLLQCLNGVGGLGYLSLTLKSNGKFIKELYILFSSLSQSFWSPVE